MPLEAALLAYAGFAALALGTHRHRRTALPWIGAAPRGAARLVGGVLLVFSFASAMLKFGPRVGPVAWAGLASLAALALVLLMSRWPRAAATVLPPVAVFVALLATLPSPADDGSQSASRPQHRQARGSPDR